MAKLYYSYNKKTRRDVFGSGGEVTIDHIFPKKKDGSSSAEANMQMLSKASNFKKKDNLSGCIRGIHYRIVQVGLLANGKKIGAMEIFVDGTWYEVVPVI